MKNLRILAAATLFALTSIAMLAGCGDLPGGSGDKEDGKVCERAEECGTGYACVEFDKVAKKGKCRVDCAKNNAADQSICDTKAAGKVCTDHPITDNAGNITGHKYACSPKAQDTDKCSATKPTCTDNTKVCDVAAGKCVKDCNKDNTVCKTGLQTCGSNGLCEDVNFWALAILDVNQAADAACKAPNEQDAGADIVAISLANEVDGTAVAWAKGYSGNPGHTPATGNNYNKPLYDYPDGAPQQPTGQCIIDGLSGHVDKFTSLGCGGSLMVNFMNATNRSEAVPFTMGQQVTVFEFSSNQCTPGKEGVAEDKYEVYACTGKTTVPQDLKKSCVKISGETPLEGYAQFVIGSK